MFYQFIEDAPYVRYNSDKAVNALSSDEQEKWHFWDGTVIDPGNHNLYKFDKMLKWDENGQKYTIRSNQHDYHNSDEFAMYGEKRS